MFVKVSLLLGLNPSVVDGSVTMMMMMMMVDVCVGRHLQFGWRCFDITCAAVVSRLFGGVR